MQSDEYARTRGDAADMDAGDRGGGRTVVFRSQLERAGIVRGSEVVSKNLERIGVVEHLAFDPTGSELESFTVRPVDDRAAAQRYNAGCIETIADGAIYLTIDTHGDHPDQ